MSTEELKEYLGIVVDMEESVFFQNRLCQNIGQEIERLKIPTEFPDPDEPIEPPALQLPAKPDPSKPPHSIVGIFGACIGLFFAVGVITTIIITYYAMFVGIAPREVSWPVLFSLIVPIAWIAYCIRDNKVAARKSEKVYIAFEKKCRGIRENYQKKLAQYEHEIHQYRAVLKENQLKRQQDKTERETKTIFLENQKKEVKKKLAISKERLQIIYQKNIIFPKYRNLAMACSLYEYICAGRCTELEGHEGAYNILEAEIRLDHIILQLDKVIAQLEQIRQNQFTLYSAVQECNRRLGLIMGSIREMAVSLNNFYSSSIQNSIQLNAQIAELKDRKSTRLNSQSPY